MADGLDAFAQRVGTKTNKNSKGLSPSLWAITGGGGAPQADIDWTQIATAATCWAQKGDGYFPVTEVVEKLPPGAYRARMSQIGPYLEKMPIEIDKLLHLPDSASETLLAEFKKFWTLRDNFAAHGFTFKRGMLLWGPPGSGKTSAIWQMTELLVNSLGGIVLFVEDPALSGACVSLVRRIEPKRPLICVYEDIDAIVDQFGEHNLLAMLDGETQTNEVVHVATTNYPERLDKRFVDRPSRFDTIMLIDMPGADARLAYLKAKVPEMEDDTLTRWVEKTDGYSIAHLRELIVAVLCFEQKEDAVFERLNAMRTARITSDGEGGIKNSNFGFKPT